MSTEEWLRDELQRMLEVNAALRERVANLEALLKRIASHDAGVAEAVAALAAQEPPR